MNISTLKACPQYFQQTLKLIEESFQYQSPNRFNEDFYLLINSDNHHNCFILIENNEVIAHIGIYEQQILGITFAMIGGIAVRASFRGKGYFQTLMSEVMSEKRSDIAFFVLWSDQEKLYKKFGFSLCGSQFELSPKGTSQEYVRTKLHLITESQFIQLNQIYSKSFFEKYTTVERTIENWKTLSNIKSADIFIKKDNGVITNYFFMNKGQDLSNIIYEYGSINQPMNDLIEEIRSYGKVWTGFPADDFSEAQYQFLLAPGNTFSFSKFMESYTNGKVLIKDINPLKQEVYFYFNEELLSLEIDEFLKGFLGPNPFEEIESEIKPIFISGLISI